MLRGLRSILVLAGLSIACVMFAQTQMDNEGVIKLVRSGITEDMVISVIQQQPGAYSLGADDLVALKAAGISERVIAAMLAKRKSAAALATPGGASAAVTASGAQPAFPAPGIYYRKGNEYFELLSEEVTWKTSGKVKNIVTATIVKKDLKGNIAGPSSRNYLSNPMEIILHPPSGVAVNSYILLPMRVKKGMREFNVGPVNQNSGVAKGALAFGVEKVGENMFRLILQTPLGPGEYGILTTIPSDESLASGKMYTFRILL
jgi:hypothetical protein